MKKLLFTTLSVCLIVSFGYGQVSKEKTSVEVRVESKTGKGMKDKKVSFESMYTGKKFKGKTGDDGVLVISLFRGDRYKVNVDGLPRTERLVIPREQTESLKRTIGYYYIDPMTAYSLNNKPKKQETTTGTFNLSFKNLDGSPLDNEVFTLVFKSTNDTCIITTNSSGKGSCPIVAGEMILSSYLNPDFETIKIPDNHLNQTIDYNYKTISTTDYLRIEKEREDARRARELKWKADSLRLAESRELREQRVRAIMEKYPDEKRDLLERVGIKYIDPEHSIVNKVFERNPDWNSKLIVVDVTGSMFPYAQELGVWYVLNQELAQDDYYVWFQDGDTKPTRDKVIGKTGGIYDCYDCSLDKFIASREDAMSRGGGGDGPENDIEALLHGINTVTDSVDEIILIADNYSSCRDLSLMSQINRPIRIIACGSSDAPIHPDYIRLARLTGGSIHTLTEDITGLQKILEGQTIKIGDHTYQLLNKRFVPVD